MCAQVTPVILASTSATFLLSVSPELNALRVTTPKASWVKSGVEKQEGKLYVEEADTCRLFSVYGPKAKSACVCEDMFTCTYSRHLN